MGLADENPDQMTRYTTLLGQLLLALIPATLAAQSASWNTYVGGAQYDGARAMLRTDDGGTVMVGYTGSFGPNASNQTTNCYVVKVVDEGTLSWTSFFGGNYSDELFGAELISDGSILVAGFTRSSSALSSEDILLARLSSDGDLLWAKRYGSSSESEYAWDLAAVGGDQFVLTGYAGSANQPTSADAIIMLVDAEGNVSWTQRSTHNGVDNGKAVALSSDDKIIVTGSVQTGGSMLEDAWIAKLDLTGQVLWSNTYSALENNNGTALVATSDGGALVTGQGIESNNSGVVASKVGSDGTISWSYRYNFISGNSPTHVLTTSGGDYLITGTASYGSPTYAHCGNYLIDPSGTLIAHSIHGWFDADFYGASCLEEPDQTFTFSGQVRLDGSTQGADMRIAHSGPVNYGMADGCMMNLTSGETSAPYAYSSISPNPPLEPITLSPTTLPWNGGSDGSLGSFCSTVGLEEPLDGVASCAFPNPCDRSFLLSMANESAPASIAIIDACGRIVWSQEHPRQTMITIDTSTWREGMYCIRIAIDHRTSRTVKLAVSHQ